MRLTRTKNQDQHTQRHHHRGGRADAAAIVKRLVELTRSGELEWDTKDTLHFRARHEGMEIRLDWALLWTMTICTMPDTDPDALLDVRFTRMRAYALARTIDALINAREAEAKRQEAEAKQLLQDKRHERTAAALDALLGQGR